MQIKLDKFEGPLDLLLQLIEEEELDITEVSLLKVAEQYIDYLNKIEEERPERLADFLVVAARLLFLKSRALLPELTFEDESGADELEAQLKLYQKYFAASRQIEQIISAGRVAYGRREYQLAAARKYILPPSLNPAKLAQLMREVLSAIQPFVKLTAASVRKIVSIKHKIIKIRELLRLKDQANLREIADGLDAQELIVSFLGMLELCKQGELAIRQEVLFGEIVLQRPAKN